MRPILLLLALPLLATFAPASMLQEPTYPRAPTIWAEPVQLHENGSKRLGRLTYLGGWWLRSNHPDFGGISAIHVRGSSVLALSDNGMVMRFSVPSKTGALPLWIQRLSDTPGTGKKQRDTEAMAVHDGRAWIAFERANSIFRYQLSNWRSNASARPEAMKRWPLNSGSEAMVRLRDGRFLVFSEGEKLGNGVTEAILFNADPAIEDTPATRLGYLAPSGFRITDAAELPDGRLLFLNRRLSLLDGFQVKLTIADKPRLEAGTVLKGREIATFAPPVTTDNYEGLSIGQEGGRTIIWIASDDNFIDLERTLLFKFELDPAL
jgi:hypothetical protein